MSHQIPPSPTHQKGFVPLSDKSSFTMNNNDIPMEQVRTNTSSTWKGRPSTSKESSYRRDNEPDQALLPPGSGGRRRLKRISSKTRTGTDDEEVSTTGMGKIYLKIINFSIVTRYLVFVLPVAALIAVPLALGATVYKDIRIGRPILVNGEQVEGMSLLFFSIWMEVIWLSIWVSKLVAKTLPYIFMFLCGVVSSGTRKYALVLKNLELPLSFVGWAGATIATFRGLTHDPVPQDWRATIIQILGAVMIATLIFLAEKLIVQMISISYHQRSFEYRIKESKRNVHLLSVLFEASRTLFPMYCPEFAEEDYVINDSLDTILANSMNMKGHSRSGSATPMRLIGEVGRFGDKVTSVFGNIASEIAGKQVFNPTSAHSVVVEALEKKRSSEALAKRLWMSFVVEGQDTLRLEDIREVLGPAHKEEADEAFSTIDADNNGDISLDEMIMKVVEISKDRKAIAHSMNDIGGAIAVLDSVLFAVAFVLMVFVFVAFLNASFVTTLATAGTTLLSLSFVFAVTCQEFLGSCIFLFVKHPYDVGDRVDISGQTLVVEQISLLYTVFKRIDFMKTVQVPNIVLNTMWVENISRSKAMKEQLDMFISFDTTMEDIEILRSEMEAFVRHPDNSRDFLPNINLECYGIGEMNKLQLRVEIRHKSNWHNETVRAARRSKFMCALVLALRKVPIYAPGGGGKPLGDPENPTYAVAVTDQMATAARDKYAKSKEEKRLVPTPKEENSEGKSSSVDTGVLGSGAEALAMGAITSRIATDDAARDESRDDPLNTRAESLERERSHNIDELREGLLHRQTTKGKRRPGAPLPPQPVGASGTSMSFTPSSPRRQASRRVDEEASVGLDNSMYNGNQYGRNAGQVTGASYSMFPPPEQINQQGQPFPPRDRSMSQSRGRQ